jgi:hypothetical protein
VFSTMQDPTQFLWYRYGPRHNIETRIGTFAPYNRSQGKYHCSYEEAKRVQQAFAKRARMMERCR